MKFPLAIIIVISILSFPAAARVRSNGHETAFSDEPLPTAMKMKQSPAKSPVTSAPPPISRESSYPQARSTTPPPPSESFPAAARVRSTSPDVAAPNSASSAADETAFSDEPLPTAMISPESSYPQARSTTPPPPEELYSPPPPSESFAAVRSTPPPPTSHQSASPYLHNRVQFGAERKPISPPTVPPIDHNPSTTPYPQQHSYGYCHQQANPIIINEFYMGADSGGNSSMYNILLAISHIIGVIAVIVFFVIKYRANGGGGDLATELAQLPPVNVSDVATS